MQALGYNTYRQTGIMTADPKRLVILCYEEAIRSLNEAGDHCLSRQYESKGKAVQRVLDILNELRSALDFERGEGIAKNLDLLYGFMIKHIIKGDQSKDTQSFRQVASMLETLKSAWESAFYSRPEGQRVNVPNLNQTSSPSVEYLR